MQTNPTNSGAGTGRPAPEGEQHLASGEHIAMRKWANEAPGEPKPASRREYETIGYALQGKAELHMGGNVVTLTAGSSWVVPHGAEHTYRILETFSAVEVTHPPYRGTTPPRAD